MSKFANLEDFFVSEAKEAILLKYADIIFGKYFIYLLTPQNKLYPCVVYNSVISQRLHKEKLKPVIHFCNCKDLWESYNKDSSSLKAKIPLENSFNYSVGKNSTKIFYKVELPFCESCINIYENILFKFSYTMDFHKELFLDKNILALEQITIDNKLNTDSSFSPMDIKLGDKYFILSYKKEKMWLSYQI
ncbi:MAG: hypothetical protein K2P17_06915 [Helicobacteraceae bacterium]|nr:hypothetical protein [Helicobacteraceae bacterium]